MNTALIQTSIIRKVCDLRISCRYGHTLRGKPPGIARTLQQRLAEDNAVNSELSMEINIGFPFLRPSRSSVLKERLKHVRMQRDNPKLEKMARENTLAIDLEKVDEDWTKSSGPYQIKDIANHYGIYEHLFGDAYFIPRVFLTIKYESANETFNPVYFGNTLKVKDIKKPPIVKFNPNFSIQNNEEPAKDSLWSLIYTNPDGHLTENDKEYVHWFIGNIPNGKIEQGEEIVPYLPPFPPKGTGFHRNIFILYKQENKIDFNEYKINDKIDLEGRTFKTLDFYRKYQDSLTPAGLAFFQSDWEESLTDFYHNELNMKEPIFEYDFPEPYMKDQVWFPLRQPFNLYMDKYRDPQQVNKEYLERKLAKSHPFNGPEPSLRFPNAHPISKEIPSWQRTEIRKNRLRWGRVNDV